MRERASTNKINSHHIASKYSKYYLAHFLGANIQTSKQYAYSNLIKSMIVIICMTTFAENGFHNLVRDVEQAELLAEIWHVHGESSISEYATTCSSYITDQSVLPS